MDIQATSKEVVFRIFKPWRQNNISELAKVFILKGLQQFIHVVRLYEPLWW